MNNIPTAEEFFKKRYMIADRISIDVAILLAREFTKLHVKAALEAAAEKVNLTARHYNNKKDTLIIESCGGGSYWEGHPENQPIPDLSVDVDEDSILNAYPEQNIK